MCPWVEAVSPEGYTYYYNSETGGEKQLFYCLSLIKDETVNTSIPCHIRVQLGEASGISFQ